MSSNELCKACTLLEGLERGIGGVAITDKARKRMDAQGPVPEGARTIPLFETVEVQS
jgi:cytoplasmic tRNA 2-thiolation protein 1